MPILQLRTWVPSPSTPSSTPVCLLGQTSVTSLDNVFNNSLAIQRFIVRRECYLRSVYLEMIQSFNESTNRGEILAYSNVRQALGYPGTLVSGTDWYWAEVRFNLTDWYSGAGGKLLSADTSYNLQVEIGDARSGNVTDVRWVVGPRVERPPESWAIVVPAGGLEVYTTSDGYVPYTGSPQHTIKARFLACPVAAAPSPPAYSTTSSPSSSSEWPSIAAAIGVPVGLAVMLALAVALACAVRKRYVGKPKPAIRRRSSITTHFSMMHGEPGDTNDPSQPQGRFQLHQHNWETA